MKHILARNDVTGLFFARGVGFSVPHRKATALDEVEFLVLKHTYQNVTRAGYTATSRYNRLIEAGTHGLTCEACDKDLKGRPVQGHDCWRCPECVADFHAEGGIELSDGQLRASERRQLGIGL
jgi:ribosomal protein L37AE/L43A